ncbi:MAG TPA: hypothetical protein VK066_15995 [Chloroflexota bacterium]|nr:hypothetical protein [Chloroflexota bacterium]
MRPRALAMSVALLLLAGTTAGVAAADQGGRLAGTPSARVASVPAGLDSLLPGDQLAPTGPAQWYMPWLTGGAGSNYLGPGGWRSTPLNYGLFGPYPLPQTAAFFGATSSPLDPYTTFLLTNALAFQNSLNPSASSLSGFGPLATLSQSGLAPLASANINQLIQLGLGTGGVNAQGQLTFTFANGGNTFVLPQGQTFGNVTLGQIAGTGTSLVSGFPGLGGFGGFGGFPFGFGTGSITGQ